MSDSEKTSSNATDHPKSKQHYDIKLDSPATDRTHEILFRIDEIKESLDALIQKRNVYKNLAAKSDQKIISASKLLNITSYKRK